MADERLNKQHELNVEFPLRVPWTDKKAKQELEAKLRAEGVIGIAKKDGSLEITPIKEFIPPYVFTAKWNSAPIEIPIGTHAGVYQDPLPIDWSLTPNPQDRLSTNDIELHSGIKYAIEGETGIIAVVTEDGLDITHVGPYQDISDRDVSPAGKTWGSGTIAGLGPLWIEIDSWDELEGAQLNAHIVGIRADGNEGDDARVVTIPADINKLARHWREELIEKLTAHEVFRDAKIPVGTRVLFTTGLLYWEQDYEVRYFHTDETPNILMTITLTLPDGRESESIMAAHTIDRPTATESEQQALASALWDQCRSVPIDVPTRTHVADDEFIRKYEKDRASQNTKGKLARLVTEHGFYVQGNPDLNDMQEILPTIASLEERYARICEHWQAGAGLDLTLVRSGVSIPESRGELTGVIADSKGVPIDDTLLKRSAQRAYDVGSQMWDKPTPDLIIASGRTVSIGTMQIALYGIGEQYPIDSIQRDWRLNERSFGDAIGALRENIPSELLYSFIEAPPNGENFSYVHLKALSLMLDLLETANMFYTSEGRSLRVVVCSQEGPMQLLQAMLENQVYIEDIFQPIENTDTKNYQLAHPIRWPQYTTNDVVQSAVR